MARVVKKLDNSFNKYGLDVVARPVDTYVAPERVREAGDEGSGYKQLALALAGIHKPLNTLLKTKHDERVESDIAKGKQLYADDEHGGLSWRDWAAKHPEIPVNRSVKRGYLMARAANDVKRLELQMIDAYKRGEAVVMIGGEPVDVSQTDDAEAFNAWEREFVGKFVTENVGDDMPPDIFMNIFDSQVGAVGDEIMTMHKNKRDREYAAKLSAETGELYENIYLNAVTDGIFDAGGPDGFRNMVSQLGTITDNLVSQGFTTTEAFNILTDKAMSLASNLDIENGERLLDVVMEVATVDGTRVGAFGSLEGSLRRQLYTTARQREIEEEKHRRETVDKELYTVFSNFLATKKFNLDGLKALESIPGMTFADVTAVSNAMRSMEQWWKTPPDPAATARYRRNQQALQEARFRLEHPEGWSDADVVRAYGSDDIDPVTMLSLVEEGQKARTPVGEALKNHKNTIESMVDDYIGDTDVDFVTRRALVRAVYRDFETAFNTDPAFAGSFSRQEDTLYDTVAHRGKEIISQEADLKTQVGAGMPTARTPERVEQTRKVRSVMGTSEEQNRAAMELYRKYRHAVQTGDQTTAQKFIDGLAELGLSVTDFEMAHSAYNQTGGDSFSAK